MASEIQLSTVLQPRTSRQLQTQIIVLPEYYVLYSQPSSAYEGSQNAEL
jgi:hypothetical protein